ncbi:MAG: hypothetical protein M3680_01095 [Myxococcota bacterium]|nr:hypothetical protein [Myxococcota bacterium]
MRRPYLVLLALCHLGCGDRDTTIDVTHDPCVALDVTSTAATPTQAAGIADAVGLWRAAGAPAIGGGGAGLPVVGGATIEVRFEDAAPAFHGLYDDETGIIFVNERITDPDVIRIVIAHELGHAFGLPHVDGRISLMNRGNLVTPPTAGDQHALETLWGRCE